MGWLFLSSIYLSIYLYAISIILKCIVSGIKYIHSRYGGSFTSRVYLPGTGQQLCIISTKTSPFLFVVSAGLSWPSTLIFVLWMSEHPFPTLKVDWPSGCIIFYQKLGGDAQLSSFWCCCWEIWSHSDSWLFSQWLVFFLWKLVAIHIFLLISLCWVLKWDLSVCKLQTVLLYGELS